MTYLWGSPTCFAYQQCLVGSTPPCRTACSQPSPHILLTPADLYSLAGEPPSQWQRPHRCHTMSQCVLVWEYLHLLARAMLRQLKLTMGVDGNNSVGRHLVPAAGCKLFRRHGILSTPYLRSATGAKLDADSDRGRLRASCSGRWSHHRGCLCKGASPTFRLRRAGGAWE